MRLLHAKTFVFKEFLGKNIPPYAILSHRWSEEEVSYEDFINNREGFLNGECTGYGWTKIYNLCKLALQVRLDWVWIDTACIDNRSSAELSEAINSMYAWYENSHECLVFLPDVHDIEECQCTPGIEHRSKGHVCRKTRTRKHSKFGVDFSAFHEEDLAASVWFTRSWTLQELLAPSNMSFWNSKFSCIGRKHELADIISSTTAIPVEYLIADTIITHYSVAQRMSWASRREATRDEDVAYSLLGIFEINMPLLYGEGQRAFRRLQMEIIKASADESIFAWEPPSTTYLTDWVTPGLLAKSILDFSNSGDIVITSPPNVARSHYEITNRGLLIKLPLDQAAQVDISNFYSLHWLLLLNCMRLRKRQGQCICSPVAVQVHIEDLRDGSLMHRITSMEASRSGNLVFGKHRPFKNFVDSRNVDNLRFAFTSSDSSLELIGIQENDSVDVPVYFHI